ncbi:MAG: hypothetical protein ACOCUI_02410 [bacterium]
MYEQITNQISLPYHLPNGKSDMMYEVFNNKEPVPIKNLKLKFNKGKYYSFLKDIEKLNEFVKYNYPDYYPLLEVSLGIDKSSGQEVKVICTNENIEIDKQQDLVILKLK